MPPYAVEPGTRLVDRYRLEKHLGQAGSTAYWRAQDELLDRPVGVCLLDGGSEGAAEILAAARQAAAVSDPRFLRVLDASQTDEVVYVVTEWVAASSLADLLADGPLPPGEARAMVLEIAGALAAAHQQGLAHLCLQPEHVLRTAHGHVKVAGLAVDAAVRGLHAGSVQDAARRDVEGCAAVLYAALTARWPGEPNGLPPAPRENGVLCAPRQVRAGVPDDLDDITCRALIARHRAGSRPLQTPDELVELLADAHVTTRLPAVALPPSADSRGDTPFPPSYLAAYDDTSRARRRMMSRVAWALAALVLVVGLGLAAWQLVMVAFGDDDEPGSTSPRSEPSGTSSSTGRGPVEIVGITGFDPPPGGNGEENDDRMPRVLDGDTATVWTTKSYNEQFGPGGLKEGVGLLLDLGEIRSVSSVAIALRGEGTAVELRVADKRSAQLGDYEVVAEAADQSGLAEIGPEQPVEARFLLVWLTAIPSVDGSGFRGSIAEIGVRG